MFECVIFDPYLIPFLVLFYVYCNDIFDYFKNWKVYLIRCHFFISTSTFYLLNKDRHVRKGLDNDSMYIETFLTYSLLMNND